MSGQEIKQKISFNNKQIESLSKKSIGNFILNGEISKLILENKRLQKICNHVFGEDDICEYCGIEKNGN